MNETKISSVLRGKFPRCLIAREMDNECGVVVRRENFLRVFPARQIKLATAKTIIISIIVKPSDFCLWTRFLFRLGALIFIPLMFTY